MENAEPVVEASTETPAVEDSPKTENVEGKPKAKKAESNDEKSYLLEKIEALHKDLNKERSTIKELRKANEDFTLKLNQVALKEKKEAILDSNLANLGEDFEIPSNKLPKLKNVISAFGDSENLETLIADAIDGYKAPKQKARVNSTPFLSREQDVATPANDLNGLFELAKSDPEAFKKADLSKFI